MIDTYSTLSKILSPAKYVENTGTTYSSVEDAQKVNGAMDKDAFLQLLVTQLSYQDPTEPMSNQDFSAQLAQYSTLEEMQKMNTNLTSQNQFTMMNSGAALIGKTVSGYSNTSAKTVTGTVTGLAVVESIPYLKIGSDYLAISEVATITAA